MSDTGSSNPESKPNPPKSSSSGSMIKALIPIILVVVVGVVAWQFWPTGESNNSQSNRKPVNIGGAPEIPEMGGFDLQSLTRSFADVSRGFTGVNADNVQNLTDKITGLTDSLDSLGLDKIPEGAKAMVANRISGFRGSMLDSLADVSDQGVKDQIKPLIDALFEKFKSLGF